MSFEEGRGKAGEGPEPGGRCRQTIHATQQDRGEGMRPNVSSIHYPPPLPPPPSLPGVINYRREGNPREKECQWEGSHAVGRKKEVDWGAGGVGTFLQVKT